MRIVEQMKVGLKKVSKNKALLVCPLLYLFAIAVGTYLGIQDLQKLPVPFLSRLFVVAFGIMMFIEEVVPKMVSIATFQKVLQLLLEESVHIRDIRTIIETLAEHAGAVSDPVELARRVRIALSPAIVQQIYGPTRELNVIAIEPGLERLLMQALGNASGPALDPGVADLLTQKAAEVALKQEEMGMPACLLVPDAIRGAISRLVRRMAPRLHVLAHSEIPETHTIRIGPILKGASA